MSSKPNLKNKRITYIPTAAKAEKLGFLLKINKWLLKDVGLIVEELEVSKSSYHVIKDTLNKNDAVFISGGNTFYLLQELKKKDAHKLIADQINNGKLYIGESAGAIVAAPNIDYSSFMDNPKKAPQLDDFSGLNLVDFYVVPQAKNLQFNKAVNKISENIRKA